MRKYQRNWGTVYKVICSTFKKCWDYKRREKTGSDPTGWLTIECNLES